MCEETQNFLWDLRDKISAGERYDVYKAYDKGNEEPVAAKVSATQLIFNQELDFFRKIKHENIVRFITTENVITTNSQVLFFEYCNGSSVGDLLRLPANRYGLSEDIIIQIMKDVTNGLKYLHQIDIVNFFFSTE